MGSVSEAPPAGPVKWSCWATVLHHMLVRDDVGFDALFKASFGASSTEIGFLFIFPAQFRTERWQTGTGQATRTSATPPLTIKERHGNGKALKMTVKPVVRQHASILATLDLIPALVSIIAVSFLSIFTAAFRSKRDAPSIHLHVAYTVLRKATARLTPLQLQ